MKITFVTETVKVKKRMATKIRTYRGVPLPKYCTRAVLRAMKNKLLYNMNHYGDYENTYTCNLYDSATSNEDASFHWGRFLENLEIHTAGPGFRDYKVPMWFYKKFVVSDKPNINRLNFIKDILRHCYND